MELHLDRRGKRAEALRYGRGYWLSRPRWWWGWPGDPGMVQNRPSQRSPTL